MNTDAERELTGHAIASYYDLVAQPFGAGILYVRNLDAAMAEHDPFHDCYSSDSHCTTTGLVTVLSEIEAYEYHVALANGEDNGDWRD